MQCGIIIYITSRTMYDLKANSISFNSREKIWLQNPQRKKEKSRKRMPVCEWPYTIYHCEEDQSIATPNAKVVHLDGLKHYCSSREADRDNN